MFDDPNKALKDLQDQLLAAEQGEQPLPAAPREKSPARKYTTVKKQPAQQPEQNHKAALLVALLLLEVAALFAVLAWWLLW